MFTTIETEAGRQRAITSDAGLVGQGTKMHDRYCVADPIEIGEKLRRDGLTVELHTQFSRGWTAAITVYNGPKPERGGPGYANCCSVYFDNQGKSSILLRPGAVRYDCLNSFQARDVAERLPHCSHRAHRFVADPTEYLLRGGLLSKGDEVRQRIGSLLACDLHGDFLLNALRFKHPRVASRVAEDMGEYGSNAWAFVQALTHSDRDLFGAATRDRLAEEILTKKSVVELLQGEVPTVLWP